MTQEEKAKAYDEALNDASYWMKEKPEYKELLQSIFPGLAESEDERVRKEIVDYFSQYKEDGIRGVDLLWITWLEKQKEQKPAEWSVEDEDRVRQIERIAHDAGCTQKLQEEIHDWLKSLRPQSHWKPSEEQMEALLWCTAHLGGADHRVLAELYEHLKKFKEEEK